MAVISGGPGQVEEGARRCRPAMAAYPLHFNAVCRSLVAAGESGGNLDAMLDRLANLTRKQMQVRAAIVGAMVYPRLLVVVALGVLVAPADVRAAAVHGLFKTLDTPLPPTTRC